MSAGEDSAARLLKAYNEWADMDENDLYARAVAYAVKDWFADGCPSMPVRGA